MAYTDPSTLTFATNENPLASAKLNSATNNQFLALFPDDEAVASWSPTLEGTSSNPSTSSAVGSQYRVGALQFVWARFVLSAAGSGNYFVTLPRTSTGLTSSGSAGSGSVVGSWEARDNSSGNVIGGSVLMLASDEIWFNMAGLSTNSAFRVLDNDSPWVWATGDVLSLHIVYPIA